MENVYEYNEIKDFEVKIFATGNCHSFIPMSFVKMQEKTCIIYHTEGYRQLNLEQLKNPCEILNIVEKLVLAMKAAQNHFIVQSRYSLKQEYIYVDQNMSSIKIQFIPITETQNMPIFSEKIIIFLKELHFEDANCCDYINMVIQKLKNVNLSMESLINYLGELKREAYLCGWG